MAIRHLTDEEIQDYIDGNLSTENRFAQSHLKTCEICQKALAEYKSLYLGLKDDKGFKLPSTFAKSVVSEFLKVPATKSRSNYAEIFLVTMGLVVAGFAAFYFIDLKPLGETIARILLPQFHFVSESFLSMRSLLTQLNINISLLVFSGLTLLIIGALDHILFHPRRKPISSFS